MGENITSIRSTGSRSGFQATDARMVMGENITSIRSTGKQERVSSY